MKAINFLTPQRLKRFREVLERRQKDLIVFAEDVKNEHNFSAIIRTCDAVGVMKVLYSSEAKKIPLNEGITVGSEKWVEVERVQDPIRKLTELKKLGFQIVATYISSESVNFREVDYTKPTVIVVGNELKGVSEEVLKVSDRKIVIPMVGMARSLNVSVATAVILYEAQRQREEKGMYDKPSLSEEEIESILEKWAMREVNPS